MDDIKWKLKKFEELTALELYKILQVRSAVFVVEQHCVYQDLDEKDQKSYHLCGIVNDELVAYVRLLPPGLSYNEASIGRVLTAPSYRKNGAGKLLMQEAIAQTFSLYKTDRIKIGAQSYLLKFYTALGFIQTSDTYLEDNIPHVEMILVK